MLCNTLYRTHKHTHTQLTHRQSGMIIQDQTSRSKTFSSARLLMLSRQQQDDCRGAGNSGRSSSTMDPFVLDADATLPCTLAPKHSIANRGCTAMATQ